MKSGVWEQGGGLVGDPGVLMTRRDREPLWAHQLDTKAQDLGGPVSVTPP